MRTRLQCSAELITQWTDAALASKDAADILDLAALRVMSREPIDGPALRTLHSARRYVGIQRDVLISLMDWEARVARSIGERL